MSTALGKTVLERSYSTPVYVLAATSVNNVYMINVCSPCRCEQHGKRICQHPKRNILMWFMEFRYNSYMAKCTKSNYSQRGIYSIVQRLHSCQGFSLTFHTYLVYMQGFMSIWSGSCTTGKSYRPSIGCLGMKHPLWEKLKYLA